MISFVNVSRYFVSNSGINIILQNVSLNIKKNQKLGILAASGTGKSTIIRLLAGIEPPDEGTIVTNGTVSWPLGFAAGFHPDLTGEENIRLISGLYHINSDDVCLFCKEFSELGDRFYRPLHSYSAGMRARLGFSFSMAIDFDVYIADEVLGVGTPKYQAKCNIMLEARLKERTFIAFGRNPNSLKKVCTEYAVLARGRIIPCQSIDMAEEILKLEDYRDGR